MQHIVFMPFFPLAVGTFSPFLRQALEELRDELPPSGIVGLQRGRHVARPAGTTASAAASSPPLSGPAAVAPGVSLPPLTILAGRVGLDAGMAFVEYNAELLSAFTEVSFLCINEEGIGFPLPGPCIEAAGPVDESGDEAESSIRVCGLACEYLCLQAYFRGHWLAPHASPAACPQVQVRFPSSDNSGPANETVILCDARELSMDPATALPNDLAKTFSVGGPDFHTHMRGATKTPQTALPGHSAHKGQAAMCILK
jgi:hypothetical protein